MRPRSKEAKEANHAWSARCDCRNGHYSSSGRCTEQDVVDPALPFASGNKAVFCERCRNQCRKKAS